ncbi:hypothetical protein [Ferruginibacter sp. SUN106]|uniref:hypothetical protein n=1 Tax=Ferruginibacter sp. SUN106 TaxID=2978348 RepID=UPI003D36C05C
MDIKLFKDLPQEEQDRWELDYMQSTVIVRGNILNAVTSLEMVIDLYITSYFTDDVDKSEELMNLIIAPRMSFENKVQVLMVLIEKYRPEILASNKTMTSDLIAIIQERNILAHYPLDTTPWGLQTYYETHDLTFFKFKNVREGDGKGAKKEIKLTTNVLYNVKKSENLLTLINKYHLLIATTIKTAPPPTN